jgi:hypothetical protein
LVYERWFHVEHTPIEEPPALGWSAFDQTVHLRIDRLHGQRNREFREAHCRSSIDSRASAVATGLALLGPVGFVRKYVRKFAVWVVIASLLYLSWWSLHGQHPVSLWHRHGAHGFWPGFDLVLASIVSWTPLVADYTRFARTRRTGFWSAGLGYFVPTIPLFTLAGFILAEGQASARLLRVFRAWFGWVPGGTAVANGTSPIPEQFFAPSRLRDGWSTIDHDVPIESRIIKVANAVSGNCLSPPKKGDPMPTL